MSEPNKTPSPYQIRIVQAKMRAEARRRANLARYQDDLEAERALIAAIEATRPGTPEAAALPVCVLSGFSTRAQTLLTVNGFETVGSLSNFPINDLRAVPHMGWAIIESIEETLKRWGFKLKK